MGNIPGPDTMKWKAPGNSTRGGIHLTITKSQVVREVSLFRRRRKQATAKVKVYRLPLVRTQGDMVEKKW